MFNQFVFEMVSFIR